MISIRVSRLATILTTVLAALVCAAPPFVPAALRAALLTAFVVLVPGFIMTRGMPFPDPAIRWLVICVLGLAGAATCSEALAIAHVWSPVAVAVLLGSVSLLAAETASRWRTKGSR